MYIYIYIYIYICIYIYIYIYIYQRSVNDLGIVCNFSCRAVFPPKGYI